MFIGNPFTDVPDLCGNSVVVHDGDAGLASREAVRLARDFWQHRERMQAPLTGLQESIRLAKGVLGTVILMDAAERHPVSGASGDSNAILKELLDGDYRGRALIPIVDSAAVERAIESGIGSMMRVKVGGSVDLQRFAPVEVSARVRMISDGRFRSESFGREWYSGKTAVLQADNITLVITSRPVHLFDRSLFWAHGQAPKQFDLVVVKSPHCQPHMFAEWCGRLINVDAPGSTSANLRSLGHTRCRRPIFPLDEGVSFTPEVKLFSRVPGLASISPQLLS